MMNKKPVRVVATALSVVFHPLFVAAAAITAALAVYFRNPVGFTGVENHLWWQVVACTLICPLLLVAVPLLAKRQDIFEQQKWRVRLMLAASILYLLAFFVIVRTMPFDSLPAVVAFALMGTTLFVAVLLEFGKISLHAAGMGAATMFLFELQHAVSQSLILIIAIQIFVAGLICTARLILARHTLHEVLYGYMIGSVAFAFWLLFSVI